MKAGAYFATFLLLIAPVGAMADSGTDTRNQTDNPYAQYDPDGVPLAVTRGTGKHAPTAADLENYRKLQEQAAYEKNWLLRGYEEQLRLHEGKAGVSKEEQSANIYYEIGMNRDLARLAGLPDLSNDPSTLAPKADASPNASHPAALRDDAASQARAPMMSLMTYKPLVTPFSALESVKPHSSSTLGSLSPLAPDYKAPARAPKPKAGSAGESLDLETPGMVAAKSDPVLDPSLDVNTLLENNPPPPVLMDADELHRQQAEALAPPSAKAPLTANTASTGTATPDAVPVAPPAPVQEVPMPVSKMPVPSVHGTIPDPYDILNR